MANKQHLQDIMLKSHLIYLCMNLIFINHVGESLINLMCGNFVTTLRSTYMNHMLWVCSPITISSAFLCLSPYCYSMCLKLFFSQVWSMSIIALPVVVVLMVVVLRHPSLFVDAISVFVCFTSIIVTLQCWLTQSVFSRRGSSSTTIAKRIWCDVSLCAWISRHDRPQNNWRRTTKMKKDK